MPFVPFSRSVRARKFAKFQFTSDQVSSSFEYCDRTRTALQTESLVTLRVTHVWCILINEANVSEFVFGISECNSWRRMQTVAVSREHLQCSLRFRLADCASINRCFNTALELLQTHAGRDCLSFLPRPAMANARS